MKVSASYRYNSQRFMENKLYYGDNLVWLQDKTHFPDESVDLIYLDPPFNSNTDYNLIFSEKEGSKSQAQLKAFDDTWKWEKEASHTAQLELAVTAPPVSELIRWISRQGDKKSTSMAAYLAMMTIRLLELHRILKPTGSIYLHCDPSASHYLKTIMDRIFGAENFSNEIVWRRQNAKGLAFTRFASNHDVILRYTKSNKWIWNPQYKEHDPKYLHKFYRFIDEDTGRRYRLADLTNPNKDRPNLIYEFLGVTRVWRWTKERMQDAYNIGLIVQSAHGKVPQLKRYLDEQEGTPVDDLWDDILPIQAQSKERLGYPTQKPLALLERIIKSSSNEGDVVFDPFCGCGTTIVAAKKLNRQWTGIDVTYLAIDLIEKRLVDKFGTDIKGAYKVYGNPYDFASAKALFDKDKKDKHAFELWALSLVNARSRIKDSGVDGIIGFIDNDNNTKRIVVQVKGGESLTPTIMRDLHGTVQNEDAVMGLLISLHKPTRGFYEYATHAGDYKTIQRDKPFPLLQIRTIEELLSGRMFDLPMSKKP